MRNYNATSSAALSKDSERETAQTLKDILFCQVWEENNFVDIGHGFSRLPEHEEKLNF